MRIFTWLLFGNIVLWGTIACTNKNTPVSLVPIADKMAFSLLSPKSFGKSLTLLQRIQTQYGDQVSSFVAQVEIDETHIIIVGLTPFGNRAFTLEWDNHKISFETLKGWSPPFDPHHILADLQMALWPHLPLQGLMTVKEYKKEGYIREILRATVPVIRIHYEDKVPWKGTVVFHHLERGYTLTIQTLEVEEI